MTDEPESAIHTRMRNIMRRLDHALDTRDRRRFHILAALWATAKRERDRQA